MSGGEYAELRRRCGSQMAASVALGVARSTVADRERGDMKITIEAEFAIRWLSKTKRRKSPNRKAEGPPRKRRSRNGERQLTYGRHRN